MLITFGSLHAQMVPFIMLISSRSNADLQLNQPPHIKLQSCASSSKRSSSSRSQSLHDLSHPRAEPRITSQLFPYSASLLTENRLVLTVDTQEMSISPRSVTPRMHLRSPALGTERECHSSFLPFICCARHLTECLPLSLLPIDCSAPATRLQSKICLSPVLYDAHPPVSQPHRHSFHQPT